MLVVLLFTHMNSDMHVQTYIWRSLVDGRCVECPPNCGEVNQLLFIKVDIEF